MNKKTTRLFTTHVFLITLLVTARQLNAQSPGDWQYASAAGGATSDVARAIATDAIGNSYVTGYFDVSATFSTSTGTISLTAAGGNDIFLAKFDPSGNAVWAKSAGGKGVDQGIGIRIDNNGNSYVTGHFSDTAIFMGGMPVQFISSGSTDIFIAKYDVNGDLVWARKAGGAGADYGNKIAIDGSGNNYVTGYFASDTLVFYNTINDTLYTDGQNDIFITMLDVNGDLQWIASAGGSGNDYGYGIAVNGTGDVYVTGAFLNTAYFYGAATTDSLTALGSNDIFTAKYDTNGDEVWVRQGGSLLTDQGSNITLDASGNCYVTGNLSNNCTFYAPPANINVASNGLGDIFLASYDAMGNIRWAKHAGGSSSDFSSGIDLNASNHCSIAGSIGNGTSIFYGAITNLTLTSAGSSDIFVAEYDTAGNVLCAQQGGGTAFDRAWDLSSDAAGNSYLAGQFSVTATFQSAPSFTLTSAGGSDIFVGKWLSGCNGSTGIVRQDLSFNLYPNPAGSFITLEFNQAFSAEKTKLVISDIMGRELSTYPAQPIKGLLSVDVSSLPRGLYLLRLESDDLKMQQKFVKE